MINLICTDKQLLRVCISNEIITLKKTKYLVKKSKRIILQNSVTSVVVELKQCSRIDKRGLELVNRIITQTTLLTQWNWE